jgi:hypothetical protein
MEFFFLPRKNEKNCYLKFKIGGGEEERIPTKTASLIGTPLKNIKIKN